VGDRVCLRCDWTGETDGEACPRCGAALYRIPESTKPSKVIAPHPQPQPAGEPMPGSPIEAAQDDESVLQAVPAAANRRWWVIAGGAFAVAAVWVVATGGPFARTDALIASGPGSAVAATPVNEPPTVNPADAAAEEVARGFLDALAAFDAQKAMTYVADNADITGIINPQVPADTEGLSLMLSMLEASGSKLILPSCETAALGSDTSVVCDFDFHLIRSDLIGRGPFSGNSYVFTVRNGAIVRASVSENSEKSERRMWEPFAEWVSSTYPRDAAVMYLDRTLAQWRLSPESIRLWERHSREYAETRRASAAPDVQKAAECSFVQPPARAHLKLTDFGNTIKARFVLHQMTLPGHPWRIVLAQNHVLAFFPQADDWRPLFEGTRLATGDSGDITVQRSVKDVGVWVRAKARDRLTGQFCTVRTNL
jgi:hypothetical protein